MRQSSTATKSSGRVSVRLRPFIEALGSTVGEGDSTSRRYRQKMGTFNKRLGGFDQLALATRHKLLFVCSSCTWSTAKLCENKRQIAEKVTVYTGPG